MVKVSLIGFRQLENIMSKAPERLVQEIKTEVRLQAEHFRELAVKDAPADVGGIKGSIVVEETAPTTYSVTVKKHYGAYMEFGTKSRFVPIPGVDASPYKGKGFGDYFDFLENILNWVKRKGIASRFSVKTKRVLKHTKSDDDRLVETAQAIANSIMRHGVRPHPFFFKHIPLVRRDFFRRVRQILKDTI